MKKIGLIVATFLMSLSYADSTTTIMKPTATLNKACTVAVDNITFGVFTPQPTGYATTTGQIKVLCTRSTGYTIGISFHTDGSLTSTGNWNGYQTNWARNFSAGAGTNSDGYPYNRVLRGANKGDSFLYDIYKDPGYTSLMGDEQGLISSTGTGAEQTFGLYLRAKSNQYVAADNYSNNVVVALNY